ncbi:MAG: ankyrin repeat domain-containing protein [Armatimonadetes bacterium]|nr:ankyrin repeat domain-containing protein [Armatimonadota bacterium]
MILLILFLIALMYTAFVEAYGTLLVIRRNRKGYGPSRIPFPIMWIMYAICVALWPSKSLSRLELTGYLALFHLVFHWIVPLAYLRWFHGRTSLHKAVQRGRITAVRRLLERGADANASDRSKITPLHIAAEKGFTAIVERLLSHGANARARDNIGITPLHYAAGRRDKDMVNLLLASGADPGAESDQRTTPKSVAASRGYKDIVEIMESELREG